MSTTLRTVCYDVAGLRGDRPAMDAMVRDLAPDVVIVQGAPRRLRWRTRCADLADRFGMVYAGGGEPSLGNVVLVSMRVSVAELRCVQYPLIPGQLFRGAILAQCAAAGVPFTVAGSQLSRVPDERLDQAATLADICSTVDGPWVLGVDTGDAPDGPAARLLAAGRQVACTAGGTSIITSGDVVAIDARVVDSAPARRASPHLPLLVDLRLAMATR